MPEARNILTERDWTVTAIRNFFFRGIWRQVGDILDIEPNVARSMIEAGNAVATSDWPRHRTDNPYALQNVTPVSSGVAGVGSINGIEGDINIVAGPNITVTSLGQNITIGAIVPTNANQISLSPAVSTWTTVQQAITALASVPPGQWLNATAPATGIYYSGKVGIGAANSTGNALNVVDTGGGGHGIAVEHAANDGNASSYYSWKQRGTLTAPLPVQAGDYIMWFGWGANIPSVSGNQGAFEAQMNAGATTADLIIRINDGTDSTSSGGQERMRIGANGETKVTGTYNGPAAAVSATAPASPQTGQLWWDTNNLRLLIWIGFWVQVG